MLILEAEKNSKIELSTRTTEVSFEAYVDFVSTVPEDSFRDQHWKTIMDRVRTNFSVSILFYKILITWP